MENAFSQVNVCKVDEGLGLVFGFAVVCKRNGVDYYDLQEEHIPEDVMLEAATKFMESARAAREMHVDGSDHGKILFAFPLTQEIAKALKIETSETGLLVGMRPGKAVLAKFKSGEYSGFSIGGRASYVEQV